MMCGYCKDCKQWELWSDQPFYSLYGDCTLQKKLIKRKGLVGGLESHSAFFATAEGFSCVQFEINQKGASQMTEIVAKSMIERINVKLSDKTIQVEGTGIELTENGDLIIWNGDFVSFVFAREQWFMACFADLDYA